MNVRTLSTCFVLGTVLALVPVNAQDVDYDAPLRPPPMFPNVSPAEALASWQQVARKERRYAINGAASAIAATGDSATYWAPIEALAYTFASDAFDEYEYDKGGLVSEMMYVLVGLGADRAYLRSFALNPQANPYLAAGAVLVLEADPRTDERAVLYRLSREAFEALYPGASAFVEAEGEYARSLWQLGRYEALPDTPSKVRYLAFNSSGSWKLSRLRQLYLDDPAGTEAAIAQLTYPPDPPGSPPRIEPMLPIEWRRDGLREIIHAPPGAVLPATLPGSPPRDAPAPTCLGRPATVYVGPDGRVVGGPLAGQPYAGTLAGTDADDVIVGTDRADLLLAGAGNDALCGGAGDDALDGGLGADTADGGPGADGCDAAETATACDGAIPTLPDVRPILECVRAEPNGRFTAFFGYENRSSRPGRIARGTTNRISPAAFDGAQPDVFALPGVVEGRPGRTPFYPGHAFTVTFGGADRVVWRLLSRTSTASATSARCAP